ncbi:MAG: TrmH family RNA methyltransferase, partial [Pseudomonadales bacterium]
TMKLLKAAGVWFVATDAEAETPLATLDLTGALCLVMGAEGSGLRRKTQDSCDYQAAIPTADPSLPLNVSVATGICLYEAHKQRTQQ